MKFKILKKLFLSSSVFIISLIAIAGIILLSLINETNSLNSSLIQNQIVLLKIHDLSEHTVHYAINAMNFPEKENEKFAATQLNHKKIITEIIATLKKEKIDSRNEKIAIEQFIILNNNSINHSDKMMEALKANNVSPILKTTFFIESKAKIDSLKNIAATLDKYEERNSKILETYNSKQSQQFQAILYFLIFASIITLGIIIRKRKKYADYQTKVNEELSYMATLLHETDDAIISTKNNLIEIWNKGAEKIYGYTKEEVIGKDRYVITRPQLTDFEKLKIFNATNINEKWQGEVVHTHKNGNPLNLLLSVTKVIEKNVNNTAPVFVSILKDITQKKKNEEKLQQLQIAVNQSQSGIIVLDKNKNILSWNKGAEIIYGYTADEVIGKNAFDLLAVNNTIVFTKEKEEEHKQDGFFTYENIHRLKDGTIHNISIYMTFVKDENNEIISFIGIVEDITQKKKEQNKINRLASIIQLSNDAILTTDKDFRISSWNKGAERLYGYTEKEILEKLSYKILPANHPLFSIENIKTYEEIGYFKTESLHRKKNEKIFNVIISFTYLKDENNTTTGFIIVINDISEVKKLQTELENYNEKLEKEVINKTKDLNDVLGRITDGFIALNKDNNFTYVNKKAGQLLKKIPQELIGKNIENEFVEVDSNFFKAYKKAMETQKYIYFEDYFKNFNSWIEIHFYPSAQGISIYFKDITKQKKSQEELVKLNYRFRTLASHIQSSREEERMNIAREIHDELGQMATSIKLDLSWIKKQIVGASEEVTVKINETITVLADMVNIIRRIAQELRPSILDNLGLTAAVEWCCGDFQRRTGIRTKFDNEVGDIKLSDLVKVSLYRICQESLTNIMRHADATEVVCSIKKNNNKLMIQVEDNGRGFDTKETTKSLGILGMQERVYLINGSFTLESKIGKGTSIKVEVDV